MSALNDLENSFGTLGWVIRTFLPGLWKNFQDLQKAISNLGR